MFKKTIITAGIMCLTISSLAQAAPFDFSRYAFDLADGERYYHDVRQRPYLDESHCGPASTIDQSRLFGSYDDYGDLLPVIGQIDAELSQMRHIDSRTRSLVRDMLEVSAEQVLTSIQVDQYNARQRERHLAQDVISDEQVNRLYDASGTLTDRSRESTNLNAMETIIPILKRGRFTIPHGMMEHYGRPLSAYDAWSECRAFWNAEIEGQYPLNHLRPLIRGENRQF